MTIEPSVHDERLCALIKVNTKWRYYIRRRVSCLFICKIEAFIKASAKKKK